MWQNTQGDTLHQGSVRSDITQSHKAIGIYGFKLCLLQSFDGVAGGHLTQNTCSHQEAASRAP